MKTLIIWLALLSHPVTAIAQDVISGRALFDNHCATCHGVGGRGNGANGASAVGTTYRLDADVKQNGGHISNFSYHRAGGWP